MSFCLSVCLFGGTGHVMNIRTYSKFVCSYIHVHVCMYVCMYVTFSSDPGEVDDEGMDISSPRVTLTEKFKEGIYVFPSTVTILFR